MSSYLRSHNCGALRSKDEGQTASLSGWVHRRRDHGGLIFIDLRDRFGITQLVFDPHLNPTAHHTAEKLRNEWVINVKGNVTPRTPGMVNTRLDTGEIEVLIHDIEVLSKAKTPPFSICEEESHVNEELRLKYRYLDMRRGTIAQNLVLRHNVMLAARNFLSQKGFLEISTPILGKSTPEGARDYLVPSRLHPGSFYALPQSPQLYKQLFMVGGLDRYFQIAPCFRDEDLRSDRQPEFTQIDLEMSFGTPHDLMEIIEELLQKLFYTAIGVEIPTPFRHLSHQICMEKYGTDRPDLRFGMELIHLDAIASKSDFTILREVIDSGGTVKGLCVKGGAELSRKTIDGYIEFVQRFGLGGLAWLKRQDKEPSLQSSVAKFFSPELQQQLIAHAQIDEGDLLLMVADNNGKLVNQSLDHLRRHIAKELNLIPQGRYEFVWVTDFPLFSWNAEASRLESEHHPFTSPLPEDIPLLESSPLKARSSGYDIVLNGYELGGGSQRIHQAQMQQLIFSLLNLSEDDIQAKFGFFIDALKYGTPPHLGIALGLDRLIMLLAHTDNIRDVIAFPKTQHASDLMNSCPSMVAPIQLEELKLRLYKK